MSSAGIYTQTIDLSLYASNESDTYFGVVGHFSKGTISTASVPGDPTLITSYPELIATFGKPRSDGDSQAWFACREYLRRGNKLKVVRVESAATPAVAASSSIRGYEETTIFAGTANGATVNPSTMNDAGGGFTAANVEPGDILYISAGADAGYYEIATVTLDTQITVVGLTAWTSGGGAGQTYSIISGKRQSLADGVTSVPALRTFTSAAGAFTGTLLNSNVQAGDILRIIDAAPADDGDNGLYYISSVTNATTLVVNRDFPEGGLTGLTYEIYTHNAGQDIGATSIPATRTLTCAGHDFTAHGVVAGDILVVNDTGTTGDNGTYIISNVAATVLTINQDWPVGSLAGLTFRVFPAAAKLAAYTEGTWGDNLEVFVTSNAGSPSDSVDIEFKEDGVQVEKWFGVTYATLAADLAATAVATPTVVSGRGGILPGHDEDFAGGVDGNSGIVDGDYIGSTQGLQLFASAESERVDVLAIPGAYSQAVGDALLAVAEVRQNCIALVDPPPWATVDTAIESVQWHNGAGSFGRTTALASSFVATYWPWVKVYDEYNAGYVWTAPSGHAAAVFANNDTVAYPWFAPAGGNRGRLLGASGLRVTPTQGQRDYMQAGTNCVNPIVNYAGEGVMIYGQKTCLRSTTALNRLNVRRMVMWITSKGSSALRNLIFDPNDVSTWKLVKDVLEPLARFVKKNRGLNDYLIVCDETNNTAITMANYQLIVDVYLKPTLSAEQIHLRFTLTSQDANFEELSGN